MGQLQRHLPRQHEHIIILANSEATSVLDIGTTLAALTLG